MERVLFEVDKRFIFLKVYFIYAKPLSEFLHSQTKCLRLSFCFLFITFYTKISWSSAICLSLFHLDRLREAAKKVFFNGRAIRLKIAFFDETKQKKFRPPLSSRGGG